MMLLNCGIREDSWQSEIQPVHPKGDQSWVFTGRTDVEAETPILWPPDAKTDSLEKTLMLGKIEGRRRGWRQRMRWLCCRKGDPFQGPKLDSCLILRKELSKETRADKARDFIGKGTRVESSRVREPRRSRLAQIPQDPQPLSEYCEGQHYHVYY